MSAPFNPEINWAVNTKTDSRPIIRLGVWTIGIVFLLFVIWGALFPLASAVITPGTLVSEGRNKVIQHPVGGRALKIHVEEGASLSEGQVILELDPVQAQADLSRLNARHASLSALLSRLDAERSGGSRMMATTGFRLSNADLRGGRGPLVLGDLNALRPGRKEISKIAIDPEKTAGIINPSDADRDVMDSQREAYASGRNLLTKEIDALEKKIATLRNQKGGIEARIASQGRLRSMTMQEIARLKPLARQGYIARSRVDERQRTVFEMDGAIAAHKLDAESYESQISEVLAQMQKARVANSDAASKEYARIVAELAEIADQRIAARSVVRNLVVRAPVSGKLTNLTVTTNGGVFSSGDVIGEIVPAEAPLLVEARVAPADIEYVRNGQKADIAITAFDRRLQDTLDGEVVYVSADSRKDEKTGEQFFVARLKLLKEGVEAEKAVKRTQAGMQGEVYIHTGTRTFLAYLTRPIVDSFRRAFRER